MRNGWRDLLAPALALQLGIWLSLRELREERLARPPRPRPPTRNMVKDEGVA